MRSSWPAWGISEQGVYVDANNTTIGGTNPQENNVIAGNQEQGIWIDAAATGNVIEGNQIGMIGPSSNGRYYPGRQRRGGRAGGRIEQRHRRVR